MNRYLIVLGIAALFGTSSKTPPTKTDYLKTYAKAYGYIKYFHPSDEASAIDWNAFSAYGAEEILKCNSPEELINKLNSLFQPIAPAVVFSNGKQRYDFSKITPENKNELETTYWQHRGVSLAMNYQNYVYSSVRVNRYSDIDETARIGNLSISLDAEKYRGKKIKYTGWLKRKVGSKGTGHLWVRVDKADKGYGFFENMDANPATNSEWKSYEIVGAVDAEASKIVVGCFLQGKGTLYADDVHLYYEEDGQWIEIPIDNGNFDKVIDEASPWKAESAGYGYEKSVIEKKEGTSCAVIVHEGKISKVMGKPIFEQSPKPRELVQKDLGNAVFCQIPLQLYIQDGQTYPKSSGAKALLEMLAQVDENTENLAARLGNVINVYNVLQHFYPYFEEAGTLWGKELETALTRCFNDTNKDEHLITLQKFTAKLKDGHARVWNRGSGRHVPPIQWEWIEDQLVITEVLDESLPLNLGDIVTHIDGKTAREFFNEVNSRISAGNQGWLDYRAKSLSRLGEKNSKMTITVDGTTIELVRSLQYNYEDAPIAIKENLYKPLGNDIYYLNLDDVPMDTINHLLPKLEKAKGIICDLRGYPNRNHEFISHLLKEKDTSMAWMRIPEIIYPDQERITGYQNEGWGMEAKKPYLGDKKVVFIVDGRAISYAESFMGFIEGYDLAAIVGQPTAGTNGNINPFKLLDGFGVNWTGMKVFKHDGSMHHTVGILPDVYVERTIEGVKSGKDEFLEKAIEVIQSK